MSRDHRRSAQVQPVSGPVSLIQPRSVHQNPGLTLQRIREVNDGGSRLLRRPPVLSSHLRRSSEEDKVHPFKRSRLNSLDEGNLIADRLKLARLRLVVEQ